MSVPDASKALSAPSLAPRVPRVRLVDQMLGPAPLDYTNNLFPPNPERHSQVVSKLLAKNDRLDPDGVEALFDLARNATIRQLLALNKKPPAMSESYFFWLADEMVWTRFVPDEPFPFEEPQLSPGLFLHPSVEYATALLSHKSKQREMVLQAAPGSTTEPGPKWRFEKFGSPIQRMKLMRDVLHRDSWPAITKTRHLTIRSPFGLTLHSSLWNNNVGQLKRILPGPQTLPAVLCPWGRDSPLRLEVTSSALARGFLDLVLLLDSELTERICGAAAEQFISGYMFLLKWYLNICCPAQDEHPVGVNLYAAVIYQREKAFGHPCDEAYSWVDNPLDLKIMHEQLARAETLLWLNWQKVAETAYSTSEISKANTFEAAKAAIYKAADCSFMSGIKREHALLLLHEIWQRRGSFLDRFEIEKEYDRLVTDYLLPDVVSTLDNFFDINEMPEKMREWAAANPFNIKRKDTEQLCELMWRAWRQRMAGFEAKQKKVLFMYQVQHARKMYREYLAELKLCGKGVDELKESVCKNEARFFLPEELRLQLALDEYEKQLEAPALNGCQNEGEEKIEASQNDEQEKDAEREHNDDGSAPPEFRLHTL